MQDLITEDVMMLDCGFELFVWIGKEANAAEKKGALQLAIDYIKGDMSGRTPENTVFVTIQQGQEPPNFSGHFMGWSEKASAGKSYAELKAALAGGVSMSGELGSSVMAELSKFNITANYTWAQLTGDTAALISVGMDLTKKEQYLIDSEFKAKFGMERADFNKFPAWKREGLKKKYGIY